MEICEKVLFSDSVGSHKNTVVVINQFKDGGGDTLRLPSSIPSLREKFC